VRSLRRQPYAPRLQPCAPRLQPCAPRPQPYVSRCAACDGSDDVDDLGLGPIIDGAGYVVLASARRQRGLQHTDRFGRSAEAAALPPPPPLARRRAAAATHRGGGHLLRQRRGQRRLLWRHQRRLRLRYQGRAPPRLRPPAQPCCQPATLRAQPATLGSPPATLCIPGAPRLCAAAQPAGRRDGLAHELWRGRAVRMAAGAARADARDTYGSRLPYIRLQA
jgi:hypothetical protein